MNDVAHVQRPRTVHERRSRRTRERLADAAIDCLVESGYRGTSFVEVCRRAGLTRGAAHHHYRDLPALMLDAMRRLNQRLHDRAAPALRASHGVEKRIDEGLDAVWELFTAREFRAVVEIWVAQSHDPALARRIRSEMSAFAEVVAESLSEFFPEFGSGHGDALVVVHFVFLVMVGMGFVNATIAPVEALERDGDRTRLRELLRAIVQREAGLLRRGALPYA